MVSPGCPAMLQTYTFTAGLARSASTMPSIRRLGRIDVYSDPGPDDDHLGREDGGLRLRVDLGVGRIEEHPVDALHPLRHLGLAHPHLAAGGGAQDDVAERGRHDLAADGEDAARTRGWRARSRR